MVKIEDVPNTDGTERPRMKYLVWYLAPHPTNKEEYPYYTAQLWAEDHQNIEAQMRVPVRKIRLLPGEEQMSLAALMACYPHPPIKPGAC